MLVKSPVIMAMMMGSLVDLKEPGSGGKNGNDRILASEPKADNKTSRTDAW